MRKWPFLILSVCFFACSSTLVKKDPSQIKAPFDGKEFENLEPMPVKSFWSLLKWRVGWDSDPEEWPESVNNPQFEVKSARVTEGVNVVVIGHATTLIQMQGLNILTDPIYSERSSPFSWIGPKRVSRPGIAWEKLPAIDVVVVSHNHYDHLDTRTLKQLSDRDGPTIFVGLGIGELLAKEEIKNVREMDWWDQISFKGIDIHFLPTQHWSARGLFDRRQTLWGSFWLKGDRSVYFAGDTGYGKFFSLIYQKLGAPDVALLPIGAYEPRWFMKAQHVNPQEAVQAFLDLRAKVAVGIHFGTFQLTDEAIDRPGKDLKTALQESKVSEEAFIVPEFGKSYAF